VEKLIIGYQTLQFKIAKSRKNEEEIFSGTLASHPALKGWETQKGWKTQKGWETQQGLETQKKREIHEPSPQYKQVS
jgi:hypothetical protein